jgi:D-alanine-D-alanine ligase
MQRSTISPLELGEARVAVLFGGTSEESAVSRETGPGILKALQTPSDEQDERGPRQVQFVEIAPTGEWIVAGKASSMTAALLTLTEVDLFFLAVHGGDGENGVLQGALAAHGQAYTGSGVAASAVCMDKLFARALVQAHGLCVAAGSEVRKADWEAGRDLSLDGIGRSGWVVKPRRGGSSVGVSLLVAPEQLEAALAEAFKIDEAVLVEEFVSGVEVSVGVLEHNGTTPRALPPVEITPHEGHFYDYQEKYSNDGARLSCPPLNVDDEACATLRAMAVKAHVALGCAGYSRTDFIVPPAGPPVYLETNTLPGMTSHSLLPAGALAVGLDYRSLCLAIAADGLARGVRA